jgi:hypothetical protein
LSSINLKTEKSACFPKKRLVSPQGGIMKKSPGAKTPAFPLPAFLAGS